MTQHLPATDATGGDSRARLYDAALRLQETIGAVIVGKSAQVRLAVTVLLAGGHLLVEDVPGVGKTMLAKTLAAAMSSKASRIQFTPDMLPSDVTGVAVYRQHTGEFEFQPGPVFANIVIGDEINRASPKTQSALLECMEEHQVSVDGITHPLPSPFTVFATQNPIEMEGTYALPEAQRDRFMARTTMGYPKRQSEIEMLERRDRDDPLARLVPAVTAADVDWMIREVGATYAAPSIKQYVVDLARSTRSLESVRVGVSPRASLHLLRAAKANAALEGRDYVVPDDVAALVAPVFAHRLVLASRGGRLGGGEAESHRVLEQIVAGVRVPTGA